MEEAVSVSAHNITVSESDDGADDCLDGDNDFGGTSDNRALDPAKFNAMFTLSLETKHRMSQAAIDSVVSSVGILVENHLNIYKQHVKAKLTEMNVNAHVVDHN